MSRNARRMAVVLALGLVGGLLVGCDKPAALAATAAQPTATRVAAVHPERATIRRATEQPGQAEAAETTALHAKLAGYLKELTVDIGDRVKRGQVLATIDVPEVDAELGHKRALLALAQAESKQAESAIVVARAGVARAAADIEAAKAGILAAEADLERERAEYGRIDELVRERASTAGLRDEARGQVRAAEAGRDAARSRARSAEAAQAEAAAMVERARADLAAATARIAVAKQALVGVEATASYRQILAPFDGIVTRRSADPGHLTAVGGMGTPLFVVARSDRLTVVVDVPESEAALVDPGDPAEVRWGGIGGLMVASQVTRSAWALDAATRTLRVEIDLPEAEQAPHPGTYALVTIVAGRREGVLSLPVAALVREGGRSFCVVVVDGQARRREVVVGLSDGARVEIVSGIGEGDVIVAAEAAGITEGQPLEPRLPAKSG